MCLGFEPVAAGCKAQMNPLSYGGTPDLAVLLGTVEPSIAVFVIFATLLVHGQWLGLSWQSGHFRSQWTMV